MAPPPAKRARKSVETGSTLTNGDGSDGQDGEEGRAPAMPSVVRDVTRFKIRRPTWEKGKKRRRSSVPNLEDCKTETPPSFPASNQAVFKVIPQQEWKSLSRYRKFTINDQTFNLNETVLVNPNTTVSDSAEVRDHWLARVMEIRASDPLHVYLRVYWLYWPDELTVGRAPYHGEKELVPSNAMQIIDAMTVNGRLAVEHWDESVEGEKPGSDAFFWRQTFDVRPRKLSEIRKHCIDQEPYNPDETLVTCPHCAKTLHAACVAQDAVKRACARNKITLDGEAVSTSADAANGVKDGVPEEGQPSADGEANGHAGPNGTLKPPKAKPKARRKSGMKAAEPPAKLAPFAAEIRDGKVRLTDQRTGYEDTTTEAMQCLFCREEIKDETRSASPGMIVGTATKSNSMGNEVKLEGKLEEES